MAAVPPPRPLDRYAQIGNLSDSVRWLLGRTLLLLAILLAGETGLLFAAGSHGAIAFGLIAAGTLIILSVWRTQGIGLPIVPLIALQHLAVYGLPIVVGHETLELYPESFITKAGLEVLLFSCCLASSWRIGMQVFRPATALSYALRGFKVDGSNQLRRLGFTLIIGSSCCLLLQSLNLLDPLFAVLPEGSVSLFSPLIAAAATCGFFLISLFIATGAMRPWQRFFFWALLILNAYISAAEFLLSATTSLFASVLIGLFWGTGRMPWRYLSTVVFVLAFLNLGKFTMRERYWGLDGEPSMTITLSQTPRYYGEWIQASYETIFPDRRNDSSLGDRANSSKGQSLFERVNNLQNLLFVIDAMEASHLAPLYGETYTLIPALLVPRILWPDKPRSHEGQVLLNVHFGRQDIDATFQTYIAWGLLPEAYGNFGAVTGALFLGTVLGLFSAWLENFTAQKLLISLEGFISFTILLGLMGSFEMVASVLVTSIFQSIVVLILASIPFVERTKLNRPEAGPP